MVLLLVIIQVLSLSVLNKAHYNVLGLFMYLVV